MDPHHGNRPADHDLKVIEDAAQGVNAFHNGRALGSIGDLGAFSFHETKNFICGEGGALCINDPELLERAEILRDKGTNRKQFFRGQVDKYTWVDVGSSYVPSEICFGVSVRPTGDDGRNHGGRGGGVSSFIESSSARSKRRACCGCRISRRLPEQPPSVLHHPPHQAARDALIEHLQRHQILAVFHYVPLHSSPMGQTFGYREGDLPVTEDLSRRLVRLPLYHEITEDEQDLASSIKSTATLYVKTAAALPRRDGRPSGSTGN